MGGVELTGINKKRKKKSRHQDVDVASGEPEEGEELEKMLKKKKKIRIPEEGEGERQEMTKKKTKNLDVQMEFVCEMANRAAPVIGYFPSGYDPQKTEKGGEGGSEVNVFRDEKGRNRLEVVVRPRNKSGVEFTGKSYAGEAACAQLCTYGLGILDKETQTLRIVPIAANKIFRLEPRVIGEAHADSEVNEEAKDLAQYDKKKINKIRELTNLYGSKKNKSMSKKIQASEQQRNDAQAQEYLEQQLKEVELNTEATENANKVVLNIPPHDPAATTPEKAYLLDRIISVAEWRHLLDILETVQSDGDLTDTNRYPSFVLNRIYMLKEIQDKKEKENLSRILSYITHMINFMKMSYHTFIGSDMSSASEKHKIPLVTFQKFVNLFVDPLSNAVSAEKKELLISYILVLTLFADKFKTKAIDIAKDLKMDYSSLRPHYQQLGCSFLREGTNMSITLGVPLKFPDMKKRQRRR